MNFVEFSKTNNLNGKMVDSVKLFCDRILKDSPESLVYSGTSTSEMLYMDVFVARVDFLKKSKKSLEFNKCYSSCSGSAIIITPDFPHDYNKFDLKSFDHEFEHIDEGKMKKVSPNEMIGIIVMSSFLDIVSPEAANWTFWHEAGHIIARDPFRPSNSKNYLEVEKRADNFATFMTKGEYKINYEDFYNEFQDQCLKQRYKTINPKATKSEIKKYMDFAHNDTLLMDRIISQHLYANKIKMLCQNQAKTA